MLAQTNPTENWIFIFPVFSYHTNFNYHIKGYIERYLFKLAIYPYIIYIYIQVVNKIRINKEYCESAATRCCLSLSRTWTFAFASEPYINQLELMKISNLSRIPTLAKSFNEIVKTLIQKAVTNCLATSLKVPNISQRGLPLITYAFLERTNF